ncbi:MAG: PilN domain-containing protein [Sporomusaceae bacterium]|nr:PilN domain-containing protein [Sporomusaceae bacterium]
MKSEVRTLQSKLSIYQPMKAQMEAARQSEASLAEKTTTIETIQQGAVVWTPIFINLAILAAPQLWFTDLEVEKSYIRIKGKALDYSFVTAFMDQCGQSESFADPFLIHAGRDEKEPVTKFEIVLKLKGL